MQAIGLASGLTIDYSESQYSNWQMGIINVCLKGLFGIAKQCTSGFGAYEAVLLLCFTVADFYSKIQALHHWPSPRPRRSRCKLGIFKVWSPGGRINVAYWVRPTGPKLQACRCSPVIVASCASLGLWNAESFC